MRDMNTVVDHCDILFVTLDTLRYDVAQDLHVAGRTPHLSALLPASGWEERHSPANFTYAAHCAFFAGFLPTPAAPGLHPRLFALDFAGSTTTSAHTCILTGENIVAGLAARGYHTICIGGVGFFNQLNPLSCVLPGLFAESYWSQELGVTDPGSCDHQIALACRILEKLPKKKRLFLFINVSALHQPNYFYLEGADCDSPASHAAALQYVDRAFAPLWCSLRQRGSTFCILCSDHGTAYGEDGYYGHRLSHPVVWTVPYTDFLLTPS